MTLLFATSATAQTPLGTAFTYQGRLHDADSPANGLHDLRFRLYDAPSDGAQIGTIVCVDNVNVADGLFAVSLDFGGQFAGQERFLQIDIRADTGLGCGSTTGFVVLTPRQALTGAPNALFARNADQLDGVDSTAFLQSIPVPLTLSGTDASHIISGQNASTNDGGSGVRGMSSAVTGMTNGVYGQTNSENGRGVYGIANSGTGTTSGVFGQSASQAGIGVRGYASASLGTNCGGFFQTESQSGFGVCGLASNPNSFGCAGYFESAGPFGIGVYGECTATGETATTDGGYFTVASGLGNGVFAWATAPSGPCNGVYGLTSSSEGRGVSGIAHATAGQTYGVFGSCNSPSGRAVFGIANATSGNTYGVLGRSESVNGWGVYATGRLGASGTKSFRIDHPDDPANKYLLHYCAESPEVINFYSGKATLDGAGQAVVELPHYFAKINKDPRYTLTAVGAPMPMLHVAEEIDEAALRAGAKASPDELAPMCSFRIAGGAPAGKVSWRVEAVRNDRWVQQSGAPVEVEKQDLECGTYQHPELFGQPPEKGTHHDAGRTENAPRPVLPDAK